MTWLDRLKALCQEANALPEHCQNRQNPSSVSFDGAQVADIPLGEASQRQPLPDQWGELRPCLWCRNLTSTGRCLAAWRGELRAARDYSPTFPDLPQRCIGYRPKANDPDRTPGRERWPELVSWQDREQDPRREGGSG